MRNWRWLSTWRAILLLDRQIAACGNEEGGRLLRNARNWLLADWGVNTTEEQFWIFSGLSGTWREGNG